MSITPHASGYYDYYYTVGSSGDYENWQAAFADISDWIAIIQNQSLYGGNLIFNQISDTTDGSGLYANYGNTWYGVTAIGHSYTLSLTNSGSYTSTFTLNGEPIFKFIRQDTIQGFPHFGLRWTNITVNGLNFIVGFLCSFLICVFFV